MNIKAILKKIFKSDKSDKDGYTIKIDYPILPKVRYTSDNPHPLINSLFNKELSNYSLYIEKFASFVDGLNKIQLDKTNDNDPYWNNGWVERLDAISLYCMPAINNSKVYFEIGSGNSTKFVRKAINDFGLKTQMISLDPHPRAEIDQICDKIYRVALENFDTRIITNSLYAGDILMVDNSHRGFQNSDVIVFFMDILPILRSGVFIYVDDVFLPYDYPEEWLKRFYNEQYFLANTILSGNTVDVILPSHFCERNTTTKEIIDNLSLSIRSGISGLSNGIWLRKN